MSPIPPAGPLRSAALLVAVALAVAGCDATADAPRAPAPLDLTPTAREVVARSNAFGVGLFARTAAGDDRNVILSPLSASTALAMLLNGTDGATYAQIRGALGYPATLDLPAINAAARSLRTQLLAADPTVRLALANAVFYDRAYAESAPFHAAFLAAMRDDFDAPPEGLDFRAPAALDAVNGWASRATNGRIPRVLDRIDDELVLLLMDALYFKGAWTTPFDPRDTAPRPFTRADGRTAAVPTMRATVDARSAVTEAFTALELPYGRRNFSLVVVLPEAPLADFVAGLDAARWAEVEAALGADDAWSRTDVALPRFRFSTDRTLNETLRALGVTDAFDDSLADFSRMSDDPRLVLSFVQQNTFVETNEQGTEAAAVTTVGVGVVSLPPSVVVDRPFVFAIRERTSGTLLFLGQVTDPAAP